MSKRGDKKKKQILKKREYNRRGRATVILDVPSFDSIRLLVSSMKKEYQYHTRYQG